MSILSTRPEADNSVEALRIKSPVSMDDRIIKLLSNNKNLDAVEKNISEFNNFIFSQIMNQYQLQVDESKEEISW